MPAISKKSSRKDGRLLPPDTTTLTRPPTPSLIFPHTNFSAASLRGSVRPITTAERAWCDKPHGSATADVPTTKTHTGISFRYRTGPALVQPGVRKSCEKRKYQDKLCDIPVHMHTKRENSEVYGFTILSWLSSGLAGFPTICD